MAVPEFPHSSPDAIQREELAYAGGLFEGEGNISVYGKFPSVRLTIKMTDEEPIRRFAAAVGMPDRVRQDKRPPSMPDHWKSTWSWRVTNFEQTQAVLAQLWTWLGPRRRADAKAALAAVKDYPRTRKVYASWAQ